MRRRYILIGLALGLAVAGVMLVVLTIATGTRTYEVRGRVAGFGDRAGRLIVEHEAVDGYMPPMTMPFTAGEPRALDGLEAGDAVGFQLHVTSDSSWITDVAKLPDSLVARHPAEDSAPRRAASGETTMLRQGDRVPADVELISQDGTPIQLGDYRGRALVLTFIYTRCPLPDYCPLMSRRFATLQPRLDEAFGDRAALLSISFDPEYDTPKVLRNYAAKFTDDLSNWTFATGTPEQIGRVTTLFGVFPQKEKEEIIHNLQTVLVGPEGRVRRTWRGRDWKPKAVFEAVREVLASQ